MENEIGGIPGKGLYYTLPRAYGCLEVLVAAGRCQGCDQYKYFGYPNQMQNQIRLVLLVLTDKKIR